MISWTSLKHFISCGDFSYRKLILWFNSCRYSRNERSVTCPSMIVLWRRWFIYPYSSKIIDNLKFYLIIASGTTISSMNWLSSALTAWRFFNLTFMLTLCCWSSWISLLIEPRFFWNPSSMDSMTSRVLSHRLIWLCKWTMLWASL